MKRKSRRNARGQYRTSWRNRLLPLVFLIASILLGLLIQSYFSEQELKSPCEGGCEFFMVRAYEEPIKAEIEVVEQPKTIEEMILDTFKEDGELMLRIFTCESGLNPKNIGDQHLMGWLNGEYLGDSVGIAQIRTGNAPGTYDKSAWNRARANGMTVSEFRAWLQVPENNIKYAKDIYDRQGVYAWYNCYQKVK